MKKMIDEFKEFVLRGNVLDMAIGVIIGGAFTGIVTALTTDFINPLINCIGGKEVKGRLEIFNTGNYIEWGHFITTIINFLIIAAILFCMLKGINKLMELGKKKKEEEEAEEKAADIALLEEIRDLLKEKK